MNLRDWGGFCKFKVDTGCVRPAKNFNESFLQEICLYLCGQCQVTVRPFWGGDTVCDFSIDRTYTQGPLRYTVIFIAKLRSKEYFTLDCLRFVASCKLPKS